MNKMRLQPTRSSWCSNTASSYRMTLGFSCLCLWFLLANQCLARPSDVATDWTVEWQEVANMWKPVSDKDRWRAFEPTKDASTSRWWEDLMDDDLWNRQSAVPMGVLPSAEQPQSTATSELDFEASTTNSSQEETTSTVVLSTKSTTLSSTTSTTTSTTATESFAPVQDQPIFKKGEINSFVEPDPEIYYRSTGEGYGSKLWDSSIPDIYQRKDRAQTQKSPASGTKQVNKTTSSSKDVISVSKAEVQHKVSQSQLDSKPIFTSGQLINGRLSNKEPINGRLSNKEPQNEKSLNKPGVLGQNEITIKAFGFKDSIEASSAEKAAPLENNQIKISTGLETLSSIPLGLGVQATVLKLNNHSESSLETGRDQLSENKNVDVPITLHEEQEKVEEKAEKEKSSQTVVRDLNAIYGKGERLTMPHVASAISVRSEDKIAETTEAPDDITTTVKKVKDDFEDWADWDNSAFDYYDEKNAENDTSSEESAKVVKEEKTNISTTTTVPPSTARIDSMETDNEDEDEEADIDYYDEDDEDFDEENDEDDEDDGYDSYDYDDRKDEDNEQTKPEKEKQKTTTTEIPKTSNDNLTGTKSQRLNKTGGKFHFGKAPRRLNKSNQRQQHHNRNKGVSRDATNQINHKPLVIKDQSKTFASKNEATTPVRPSEIIFTTATSTPKPMDSSAVRKEVSISHEGVLNKEERTLDSDNLLSQNEEIWQLQPRFPNKEDGVLQPQPSLLDKKSKFFQPQPSPLLNKEEKVSQPQPNLLNTELDAQTSPNPAPPSTSSPVPRTTSLPETTSVSVKGELTWITGHKSKVNEGFILSFPLEFCKTDNECRAGRTCVIGVCRCYTAGMCAGHHKPVCGSDGFQYPSHCELHRVACVNRIFIRVDRRGKCFQKEIEEKEKSWLLEQEQLLQEHQDEPNVQDQPVKKVQISSAGKSYDSESSEKETVTPDVKKVVSSTSDQHSKNISKQLINSTADKKECTWKEMGEFKEALLMFYCQKFAEPNCPLEVKTDREYLSMLMFSYCDRDFDYYLTAKELDDKERDEHFSNNIILNCHLHDFIKFADNLEADGKLTVSEFTNAFETPAASPPPHAPIELIPTLASAGNGLELKCGIDAANIVWKRHGAQLSDDKRSHQLMVFDDGALFFSSVSLHHIGNYTCLDANDESKAQIHKLKVQTLPVVTVTPIIQTHVTGSDVELKCHAEGVPKPAISWRLGGEALQNSPHVTHYYGGGHIVVHNAQFDADAGTYTCRAHSQAGTTEKSVSVHILPPSASTSKESSKEAGTFVVFNSKGVSAYDPLRCLLRHRIPADFSNFKFVPDTLDSPLTLCQKDKECQWGEAVRVGSEFIYVCQPDQNRVLVMNAGDNWNPLQVIETDKWPERLWYVKHLDQVWVLCGKQDKKNGARTVLVIRDASQNIQHRSVHTQPVGNHFDMIQDLFIAPANDFDHEFAFGYVSHHGQKGLFKLSLEDMSYTKAIDLTNFGCVPTSLAFVPIGGHVVIQCVSAVDQHTLQLVMDYLTDSVTSTTSLNGRPMTSPDSRHLVTVDQFTGKVTVTSVSDEGVLETTYEVTVSASISDIAFMPAMSHQGYDLVLTSADDDDVIIMNLVTGKVEKIPGSQYSDSTSSWHPSAVSRHIVSGSSLSSYLMAPSRSSLAILDAKFRQVECEFLDSVGEKVMLYIPSTYTS